MFYDNSRTITACNYQTGYENCEYGGLITLLKDQFDCKWKPAKSTGTKGEEIFALCLVLMAVSVACIPTSSGAFTRIWSKNDKLKRMKVLGIKRKKVSNVKSTSTKNTKNSGSKKADNVKSAPSLGNKHSQNDLYKETDWVDYKQRVCR